MIRVDEIRDPAHHRRGAEAVAGRARRVVLDVEHAGQGDAVGGPAAAVGEEEIRLGGAGGGGGACEVVAAPDERGGCGAGVVRGEGGVGVGCAFGGLMGGGLVFWGGEERVGEGEGEGGFTLMITKRAPLL